VGDELGLEQGGIGHEADDPSVVVDDRQPVNVAATSCRIASTAGLDVRTLATSARVTRAITLDTTRADRCSAFGYERPTTPRLDALLPTAVRFTAAYGRCR